MRKAPEGFEHACFISYKGFPDDGLSRHLYVEWAEELQKRLVKFLTIGLQPYRDDQLRSKPGVDYPVELSRQLCRSVCLLAILSPEYWESNWCCAVWKAMEKLEAKRLPGKRALIIPVH